MKKIFAFLLIAVSAFALVGCGKGKYPGIKPSSVAKTANAITFVDHRQSKVDIVEVGTDGKVAKPADPVRKGYRFGGWFSSGRGLTWNDLESYDFDQKVPAEGLLLYAYWEPENSKTHKWHDNETYFSTLSNTTTYVLNPLNYEYADEIDLIRNLSTPLYTQEVDWGKAVKDGIADYPGDFSKIGVTEGKYGIDLLKNHYILAGATSFPKNQDGHDLTDDDGNWNPDDAANFKDTVWTIDLREDLYFEDGKNITAADYVYTYKQYIDPVQNNKRGSTFFPTQDRKNGYEIVNARSYFVQSDEELFGYEVDKGYFKGELVDGKVVFEDVGFKAKSKYTIELTFEKAVGQTSAVGLLNNIYLVHEEKFEASLDQSRENSNYGTPLSPYVSYGGYIISTWDEGQKYVLNKNYDYVLKHTINYKSINYRYTDDVHENMNLFKKGRLSGVGLSGEYAKQYAEWENNYPTYRGFPFGLEVNVTDSLKTDRKANPIMKSLDFRRALLLGVDRQDFANTAFAPNTPSIMVWPIEAKQYTADEFWYKDTPEHKEVLQKLGINEETAGYNAVRAKEYFDDAYTEWSKDNTGKIKVEYITIQDPLYEEYASYIKNSYEQLFGKDKIEFVVEALDDDIYFERTDSRDFDLAFDLAGWGFADTTWIYMPLKGLYYTWLFGDDAGGNTFGDIEGVDTAEVYKPIDLSATLAFLESTKYEREADEATPPGMWDEDTSEGFMQVLYDLLVENDGYYEGSAEDLFLILVSDDFLYAKNEEPFAGAVQDLTRISAAFEYIILDLVTLLPLASRTAVVAYAKNVVIDWPFYSYELGWGTARYRYLSSDLDFQ